MLESIEKRQRPLVVKLSETEVQKLRDAAKEYRTTMSAIVRYATFDQLLKKKKG